MSHTPQRLCAGLWVGSGADASRRCLDRGAGALEIPRRFDSCGSDAPRCENDEPPVAIRGGVRERA